MILVSFPLAILQYRATVGQLLKFSWKANSDTFFFICLLVVYPLPLGAIVLRATVIVVMSNHNDMHLFIKVIAAVTCVF